MLTRLADFVRRPLYAAALAGATLSLVSPALARPAPESFADLAARLSPAVVNISTSQELKRPDLKDLPVPQLPEGSPFEEFFKEFFDEQMQNGRPQRVNSLGSGFVIDPSGVIVTNNHVIAEADQIEVTFTDGTKLPAEIIGRDEKMDIAVLQVKAGHELAYVTFGDSDTLRVGDWVMAIGNPFGLGGTVTAGIVSARNRDINAGPYDDFIQTDASINRGNSGGPLFDTEGNVVGVNTAIYTPSGGSIGIGFAVPSNAVARVVAQLRQFGETRRGWIGVRIQTVTDELAMGLGLDRAYGALVSEVTQGGPAQAGGLQVGDLIVRFDGKDVSDMRSLPKLVAETEVGRTVDVELVRKGQRQTIQLTVGRLEENEAVAASTSDQPTPAPEPTGVTPTAVDTLGLMLSPLTPELRAKYDVLEGINGVVVTSIKGDSPAGSAQSEGRIREGDVIVEVQQEAVSSIEDVVQRVKNVVDAKGKVVLLLLNRRGELSFAAIRLDES